MCYQDACCQDGTPRRISGRLKCERPENTSWCTVLREVKCFQDTLSGRVVTTYNWKAQSRRIVRTYFWRKRPEIRREPNVLKTNVFFTSWQRVVKYTSWYNRYVSWYYVVTSWYHVLKKRHDIVWLFAVVKKMLYTSVLKYVVSQPSWKSMLFYVVITRGQVYVVIQ